uniref:Uncharacterized protein n=1 Tax=Palpitomonas bilix TaxID=652834 RepID=A0A7S3D963_9EUKA
MGKHTHPTTPPPPTGVEVREAERKVERAKEVPPSVGEEGKRTEHAQQARAGGGAKASEEVDRPAVSMGVEKSKGRLSWSNASTIDGGSNSCNSNSNSSTGEVLQQNKKGGGEGSDGQQNGQPTPSSIPARLQSNASHTQTDSARMDATEYDDGHAKTRRTRKRPLPSTFLNEAPVGRVTPSLLLPDASGAFPSQPTSALSPAGAPAPSPLRDGGMGGGSARSMAMSGAAGRGVRGEASAKKGSGEGEGSIARAERESEKVVRTNHTQPASTFAMHTNGVGKMGGKGEGGLVASASMNGSGSASGVDRQGVGRRGPTTGVQRSMDIGESRSREGVRETDESLSSPPCPAFLQVLEGAEWRKRRKL